MMKTNIFFAVPLYYNHSELDILSFGFFFVFLVEDVVPVCTAEACRKICLCEASAFPGCHTHGRRSGEYKDLLNSSNSLIMPHCGSA